MVLLRVVEGIGVDRTGLGIDVVPENEISGVAEDVGPADAMGIDDAVVEVRVEDETTVVEDDADVDAETDEYDVNLVDVAPQASPDPDVGLMSTKEKSSRYIS